MEQRTSLARDKHLHNLIDIVANPASKRINYNPQLLRNARTTTDVSIATIAALIDVSTLTISLWEQGNRQPQERFIPKVERLLGALIVTV